MQLPTTHLPDAQPVRCLYCLQSCCHLYVTLLPSYDLSLYPPLPPRVHCTGQDAPSLTNSGPTTATAHHHLTATPAACFHFRTNQRPLLLTLPLLAPLSLPFLCPRLHIVPFLPPSAPPAAIPPLPCNPCSRRPHHHLNSSLHTDGPLPLLPIVICRTAVFPPPRAQPTEHTCVERPPLSAPLPYSTAQPCPACCALCTELFCYNTKHRSYIYY
jgi:hypothetical protein